MFVGIAERNSVIHPKQARYQSEIDDTIIRIGRSVNPDWTNIKSGLDEYFPFENNII
jgi:hypothetical protein